MKRRTFQLLKAIDALRTANTNSKAMKLRLLLFLTLMPACFGLGLLPLGGAVTSGDPEGRNNLAPKSTLPWGDGLALAHPGDAGIKTNKDVIFADDFETGTLGAGWDETGNKGGKVLRLADPGLEAALGRRCL